MRWLLVAPFLLLIISSLPTLIMGYDSEIVIGFIHPFMFGNISPNFIHNIHTGITMPFINSIVFRPLYYLSFNLDYLFFSSNIFYYRLENLLWLLICLTLLLRFAGRLGMGQPGKLAMGFYFALHPAHIFMMQAIFSRTDLIAAVFMLGILNLFITGSPYNKVSIFYWLSLALLVLSLLWKELFIIIPLLLLLGDLALNWTKGSFPKRIALHLPFWLVAGLSVLMQLTLTSSLGYNQKDAEVAQVVQGFTQQMDSFLSLLWGVNYWQITWLGFALTLFFLLIGPGNKPRLLLIFTMVLLIPYLIVWPSFMHVYLASLGLALWVGFAIEGFLYKKVIVFRISMVLLILGSLISWVMLYCFTLPVEIREADRASRIVEYVKRNYPDPPLSAVFTFTQQEWVQRGDLRKILSRLNRTIQVVYHREDVYMVPQQLENNEMLPSTSPRILVTLPEYLMN